MTNNPNPNSEESKEEDKEKILERNRKLEYGQYYEQFFKPCDNCGKVFEYGFLFYLNTEETVKVCCKCYSRIKYQESIRELRRYK